MSENNFIQIHDLFVSSVNAKAYNNYKASIEATEEKLDGDKRWTNHNFEREFIIVNPNEVGEIDGKAKLGRADCSFYQGYEDDRDDYYSLGQVLKAVQVEITKANIKDAAFSSFCEEMKEAIEARQAYYRKYGRFTLSVAKQILSDEDVSCIKNLSHNVEEYLSITQEINKKAKELKKKFKEVVSPYLKEHYEHRLYKNTNIYHSQKIDTKSFYCPIREAFYFPVITFSKNSALLFEEIKKYNLRKENFLNSMSSVEEKNAKKKINGYVIYHNSAEKGKEDGFVNKNGYLTNNILTAIVFETNKLAYAYAKRRGYGSQSIITEINFEFSKMVDNHDCIPGPAMNSLISRREQGDLKEMFGSIEEADNVDKADMKLEKEKGTGAVGVKKNKI